MFSSIFHRYVYIIGILTLIWGLALSPFLISLGQFILAGNWLFEFHFRQKWSQVKLRPYLIYFLLLYLIHVIWLLNTQNFGYALNDLKIKLPLFALPIIFSSTQPLERRELKFILHMFFLAVIVATVISSYVFLGFTEHPSFDTREASLFFSHIRFAVLVVISFYILISILQYKTYQYTFLNKAYYIIGAWLFIFIIGFGAFTGLALLLFTLPFYYLYWLKTQENYKIKTISFIGIGLIFLGVLFIGYSSYKKYYTRNIVDFKTLEKTTLNGNSYKHLNQGIYENKDLVWIYVCDKELKKEWNKVSETKFDDVDEKGQLIRHTLIRYLTSLGYKKDSVGISKLKKDDIRLIEQGYTNHIFKNRFSLYPRLYKYFWEIEQYSESGNPNDHSLTMRIEFFKNAFNTFKRHIWLGTGTGDVNDEILTQYKLDNSILDENWRYRAHNQYLSFLVTFGVIGFTLFFLSLGIGIWKALKYIDSMALAFLLIISFSMLAEDTLETQAGASIAGFFLALFIFGRKLNSDYDKEA